MQDAEKATLIGFLSMLGVFVVLGMVFFGGGFPPAAIAGMLYILYSIVFGIGLACLHPRFRHYMRASKDWDKDYRYTRG